jgi:OOP family OmpA-OmpF porin
VKGLSAIARHRVLALVLLLATAIGASTGYCFNPNFLAAATPGLSIDLHSIEFREGHPLPGESLLVAAKPPSDVTLQILRDDLITLTNHPSSRVSIEGFTDNHECSGVECDILSKRRAKLVYDWLVANGVVSTRLEGPEGNGASGAIDYNEKEAGRQRNRRAELDLLP